MGTERELRCGEVSCNEIVQLYRRSCYKNTRRFSVFTFASSLFHVGSSRMGGILGILSPLTDECLVGNASDLYSEYARRPPKRMPFHGAFAEHYLYSGAGVSKTSQ